MNPFDLEMLKIKRIQYVQYIKVGACDFYPDDLEKLFQTVLSLPMLVSIYCLGNMDLSSIEPELFSRAVNKLGEVSID